MQRWVISWRLMFDMALYSIRSCWVLFAMVILSDPSRVSTNLAWEHNRFPWNFDMRERLNVVDCGDLVYAFGDAREMMKFPLQAHVSPVAAGFGKRMPFGGDHFVTLPLLRAHAKHFGKMALVHFDAHTDTYANGCEFDHGTMFYTAPKEGLIDPNR